MRRRARVHKSKPSTAPVRRVRRSEKAPSNQVVPLVQLQRRYGNSAVQRMLATGQAHMVQPFFGMPQISIPGVGEGQNDNSNMGLPGPREAFETALSMAGIPAAPIMNFIDQTGAAADAIFSDPIGFANNLIQAFTQGFQRFATTGLEAMQEGLGDWVLSMMDELDMEVPDRWDMKAMFMFVMQILKITVNQIRAKLVARFGRGAQGAINKGIQLFLRSRQGLEELWDVVKNGIGDLMENIQDTFFNEVFTWIQQGVVKMITVLNPVGSLVGAVQAIYQIITWLTEKFVGAVDLTQGIVNSVGAIASGAIGAVAEVITNALKKVIPLVINFLAELLELGELAEKIAEILERFKQPLVDRVVKTIESMNS